MLRIINFVMMVVMAMAIIFNGVRIDVIEETRALHESVIFQTRILFEEAVGRLDVDCD